MPNRPPTHQARGYHHAKRAQRRIRQRTRDDSFYSQARWRRFRLLVLQAEPLCRHCKAVGFTVPATDVDHIVDRLERPELAFVESNCQALCHSCHSRKTRKAHA